MPLLEGKPQNKKGSQQERSFAFSADGGNTAFCA
jgi:hypothetical protein